VGDPGAAADGSRQVVARIRFEPLGDGPRRAPFGLVHDAVHVNGLRRGLDLDRRAVFRGHLCEGTGRGRQRGEPHDERGQAVVGPVRHRASTQRTIAVESEPRPRVQSALDMGFLRRTSRSGYEGPGFYTQVTVVTGFYTVAATPAGTARGTGA